MLLITVLHKLTFCQRRLDCCSATYNSRLCVHVSHCCAALVEEKNTRARLRSEVDRNLTKSTVVILDGLNAIKGYRYELWCIARAAATSCCVLWVATDADTCRRWNAARPAEEVRASAYSSSHPFENMSARAIAFPPGSRSCRGTG